MNKFSTTRSQFNYFYFLHKTIFLLYNWLITFSCRQLTDMKTLLTQNLLIIQNLDAEHSTCTASQINSHSAKQNWKNKKNCYRCQGSSQRSLSPFWFQLLTIFSSFILRDFCHRQLLVFRIVKIKNHSCHTDYQPHKPCDSQTWYILLFKLLSSLHVHPWHSDLSLRLWGPWSLNVLTISFVFLWVRGPAHYETTQCYFSVGLPRTVWAFVSLTIDNILQQYLPRNFLLLLWRCASKKSCLAGTFISWLKESTDGKR